MLPEEKRQAAVLNDTLTQPIDIRLIMSGDGRSQGFKEFHRALAETVPMVRVSVETLAAMISDGNAYGLSEMMLKQGCIFPGFIDLLIHPVFSTRLGAMAAAEDIAERRLSLAVQMAAPLLERFERQSDAVQGDMLYVIGISGDDRVLEGIKKISSGEYSRDVREAAAEAIEEINSR